MRQVVGQKEYALLQTDLSSNLTYQLADFRKPFHLPESVSSLEHRDNTHTYLLGSL